MKLQVPRMQHDRSYYISGSVTLMKRVMFMYKANAIEMYATLLF